MIGDVIRLRLDISYDGTDFSGWAVQPGRRTVAGELTDALQVLLRQPVRLVAAGRTDAGVHAVGQVAHVDVGVGALLALAPRHRGPRARVAADDQTPCDGAVPAGTAGDATARIDMAGDAPAGDAPAGGVMAGGVMAANVTAGDASAGDASAGDASAGDASAGDVTARDGTARDTPAPHDLTGGQSGLLRRLAGVLPPDVRVRRVSPAPDGFDARFSALRRHYRYRIGTGEWGVEPADRRFVLARRRMLDTGAMGLAAAALIGLRDFAAFCRPRAGATTIRELQVLTVRRAGDEVQIDVVADAFCHSMVRALVGSLMSVGELRVPVGRPAALQAAGQRSAEIHVAPPHGLTLMAVDYPPDTELALRAELTRAHRSARGTRA